jgi:hypothetical protein
LSLEEFSHEIGRRVLGTDIVDGQDVRVVEGRGRSRLVLESAQTIEILSEGLR